jgi:hypothetical protein
MPRRSFGIPLAAHPCSSAHEVAPPVLAAGKPSELVRAGRREPVASLQTGAFGLAQVAELADTLASELASRSWRFESFLGTTISKSS